MATKVHTNQIENATAGSLIAANSSGIFSIVAPSAGADHLWFYDDSATALVPLTIGTNLSITGTTLNAMAGAGGYAEVQEEGGALTARTKINFIGSGLTAADDAGNTRTNVTLNTFLNTLATAGTILLSSGNVSGTLPTTSGGTGVTSYTTGDTLYASGTNVLSKLSIGSTGNFYRVVSGIPAWTTAASTDLSNSANIALLNATQTFSGTNTFSNNITMNGTPSANTDVVTVGYVNNILSGTKWKTQQVRVATTVAGTLATSFANGQTVDGVTLATNDRILIKNQASAAENGIYTVNASGAPTRATDADSWTELVSAAVSVEVGTANADSGWLCTVDTGGTLNSTAVNWIKLFSSTGAISGTGVANKVAYWSASDTLTSTTNFHFNGTQLAIGTATPATSAVLTTQGTGTGNSTYGYQHNNSSAAQVFRVADDGTLVIAASSPLTISNSAIAATSVGGFSMSSNADINITAGGSSSTVTITSSTVSASGAASVVLTGTRASTSSNQFVTELKGTFSPSGAGTNTFRAVIVNPTINQTTHTGVTTSMSIEPVLTSVGSGGHTALQIAASGQRALYVSSGGVRFDVGSDATGDMYYRAATTGYLTRIPVGSSGQVLVGGTTPSFAAIPYSPTIAYVVLSSGSTTIDLDANVGNVKDVDGNNIAFTIPSNPDLMDVYRNGILMSRSGTVTRDYSVNTSTHVITFVTTVATDETIVIKKLG